MAPSRLASDTDTEIERIQIAGWRNMSPAQKAATVTGLTSAMFEMARAGVRARFPDATAREQFLRLQGQRLDLAYLQRQAPVLGVPELLERAFATG